jgi:hypothetical protein
MRCFCCPRACAACELNCAPREVQVGPLAVYTAVLEPHPGRGYFSKALCSRSHAQLDAVGPICHWSQPLHRLRAQTPHDKLALDAAGGQARHCPLLCAEHRLHRNVGCAFTQWSCSSTAERCHSRRTRRKAIQLAASKALRPLILRQANDRVRHFAKTETHTDNNQHSQYSWDARPFAIT